MARFYLEVLLLTACIIVAGSTLALVLIRTQKKED